MRQLWDDTTRPVGPPAPTDHAYTDEGRAVGQHLKAVHDHLRAELQQVRDLIDQVRTQVVTPDAARNAINQMTMRQTDWTVGAYCASYCRVLTQHHGLEDTAVFPHLRAADSALAPVIDRLEEEHNVIHGVLENVDHALVTFIRQSDCDELQQAVDLLSDALLSHLAYEEEQITDPLARYGFYAGQL